MGLVWIGNIKQTCHPIYDSICGGCHAWISTQKYNKAPSYTTQIGKIRLWGQNTVGIQLGRQTYPPTWIQKIYTKGGGKIYILCKSSWPHRDVRIRNIISGKVKRYKTNRQWTIYFITAPQTHISNWDPIPEKWYYKYTKMHHTYHNYTLEVV